jgi:hypothetical protein
MSFPPCGNLGKRSSGFRQSGPIDRRHRRSRSAPLNLNVRTPDPGAATNLLRPEEVGLKIQCHRPGDPRRCRLARFAASSHTREYRAHAASVLRAGAELSRPFDRLRTSTNIGAAIATVAASRAPGEAILNACCDAWDARIAKSEVIASIGTRDWAQVKI